LARLQDAQAACRDIVSSKCEPYLAEAAAVSALLTDQAAPICKGAVCTDTYSVVVYSGQRKVFSRRWLE
jgi:hypothetical protein